MSAENVPGAPRLVLASSSAARAALLTAAGVPFTIDPAQVDESEIKSSMSGATAAEVAATLAELKASQVAPRHAQRLVLGADQILDCGGTLFDKPPDLDHARAQLLTLCGRKHRLVTAACMMRDDALIWQHADVVELTMRNFDAGFVDWYLNSIGDEACSSVGAYRLEDLGAQLFTQVKGDYFTVLGLPLLQVLDVLRTHGVVRR